MLTTSMKLAAVVGSMRWQLLAFAEPVIAYSDHPVVVWPLAEGTAAPFPTPQLAPMSAIEVRMPVSAQIALLMTWADEPDRREPVLADAAVAGELNAFTIGQAERQWMHWPGTDPPIATGSMTPLSTRFETGYGPATVEASARRARVARYLHRVRNKQFLSDIEIVDFSR